MVSKPCAGKEKEWVDKALCRLQKPKLGVSKGQLPPPKNGSYPTKGSWSQRMSMLDGFLVYNQVAVHPDDQERTTFATPWGTFMYAKTPFGLMNVGATFQRAMDIALSKENDKFVVIYLDDITVFSQSNLDHL
jgi:hypothetical protein